MKIALATSAVQREIDDELPLILAALDDLGQQADICVWDDPDVDWSAYESVAVRSCWDYTGRRDAFVAWAYSIPHIHNHADLIEWNTDKVYRHSEELLSAGRTSMVQPYIQSVDDEGETAMLYIGGTFSHAIRKGALLARREGVSQTRDSRESITPREPTEPSLFLQHGIGAAERLAKALTA